MSRPPMSSWKFSRSSSPSIFGVAASLAERRSSSGNCQANSRSQTATFGVGVPGCRPSGLATSRSTRPLRQSVDHGCGVGGGALQAGGKGEREALSRVVQGCAYPRARAGVTVGFNRQTHRIWEGSVVDVVDVCVGGGSAYWLQCDSRGEGGSRRSNMTQWLTAV